jgi:3-oxoacyl-[acyl-carrier-protein] synthase III
MGIQVSGVGAYVPEQAVTNHQIALMVDTTHEWITSKTGILERRICTEDLATSDLAYRAALQCLDNAGKDQSEIDLIIVATSSPDQIQPAVACLVQEKLGIAATQCPAFDVNSVCSGFVYALNVGHSMILAEPERFSNVLVIGSEVYSKILNWNDRRTCVFFGDGAGAVLLSHVPNSNRRIQFLLGTDGRGNRYIGVPAGGTRKPIDEMVLEQQLNKFYMDGRKVWEFALATVPCIITDLLRQNNLTPQDLDLVILHQANLRMIEEIMHQLGLSMDKTVTTVSSYGNTAAASIPITLQKAFEEGKLYPGCRVALAGFGGGLSWGAALLEW